jgi:branched-chain amino acid transport system permease protein
VSVTLTAPRDYWASLTRPEQYVSLALGGFVLLLFASVFTGGLTPSYFLFLLGLGGMYALLSFGLNAQWGFTGLINFSVAAFFGIGAYGAAIMTGGTSPVAGGFSPFVGLFVAIVLAVVLAVLIGVPTLRLRADYLAIASLGLAEVLRLLIKNETWLTNGTAGVRRIPDFFVGIPVLGTFSQTMPTVNVWIPGLTTLVLGTSFWRMLLSLFLVATFVAISYGVLRRVHRSPWGRVLRTIRSDEDLAQALGKDTYSFKMQSFVLGSVIMALAGVFYAHLNLFVSPDLLDPVTTFYVWVAVMLGGSGSNRGALLGGMVIVAIREGTRFLNGIEAIPFDVAPLRLLVIGVIIVLLMRFRPEGILPPQRELIWPSVVRDAPEGPDSAVREAKGGDVDE